jgi:hypothetical protein
MKRLADLFGRGRTSFPDKIENGLLQFGERMF